MMNHNHPMQQQYIKAIQLMEESIELEVLDAMFYEWLTNSIPAKNLTKSQMESIKETIISVREDELNHNKTYKQIYKQLTGKDVKMKEEEVVIVPDSFLEGIEKALTRELNAVKQYRQILAGISDTEYRDKVFNIITDELRHANLYNYIYTTVLYADNK
ncbi:MAG: ferritin family protein [Paraclostridium sp.]